MYGLEDKPNKAFKFDLEEEILNKPARGQEIKNLCQKRTQEIKTTMREGSEKKELDDLGALVNAYGALETVTKRIKK